jgi:hypothetical protein
MGAITSSPERDEEEEEDEDEELVHRRPASSQGVDRYHHQLIKSSIASLAKMRHR